MLRLASLLLLAAPTTPLLMLSQAPTPLLLVDLDALLAVDLESIGAMSCAERADVLSDALFVHARARPDADYFWARATGPGARRAAPGIGLAAGDGSVDLRWLSDAEAAARGDQPQAGGGKWSEWVEYLAVGDEVDLVPRDVAGALEAFGGAVRGVTRRGRQRAAAVEGRVGPGVKLRGA
ncbi:exodeoxyribonuclease III [Aureococcus anophagefferens]|nr:exodeoxyribonuclease III [Aureococcus anophagefferens]